MNNARRKDLIKAKELIEEGKSIIESVSEDEESTLDRMPENLLETSYALKLDENVENMNSMVSDLDDIIGGFDSLMDKHG